MKKRFVFFTLLIVISIKFCIAQNCKYKINGIDEFTNKVIKQTKPSKVIATFYTVGQFSFKKEDSTFTCIFDYVLSSYKNFYSVNIDKGSRLMFLLENEEIITLISSNEVKGDKTNYNGVRMCRLMNVNYPITKSQLEMFSKSKVKTIRFYKYEADSKEEFIDNEIKKKFQDDIQELAKCIL